MDASVASTLCVALFLGSITASLSGKTEIWFHSVHTVRFMEAILCECYHACFGVDSRLKLSAGALKTIEPRLSNDMQLVT